MAEVKLNETNSTDFEPGHPFTIESCDVDVRSLRPHPDNTYEMDPRQIEVLAENIREMGLIQPLAVRRVADGGLQILAGHRRHRALMRLAAEDERFAMAPARVYEGMSDEDALLVLHSSNIARHLTAEERRRQSEELTARVDALRPYHPEWSWAPTSDIIGQMLGMTGRAYRNKVKLADQLDDRLHGYVERQILSQNEALRLVKLPEEEQAEVADMLDRSQPKNKKQAAAVVAEYGKPVAEYVGDFQKAVKEANVAYFRLREAMREKNQPTYVDRDALRSARAWIDEILRS